VSPREGEGFRPRRGKRVHIFFSETRSSLWSSCWVSQELEERVICDLVGNREERHRALRPFRTIGNWFLMRNIAYILGRVGRSNPSRPSRRSANDVRRTGGNPGFRTHRRAKAGVPHDSLSMMMSVFNVNSYQCRKRRGNGWIVLFKRSVQGFRRRIRRDEDSAGCQTVDRPSDPGPSANPGTKELAGRGTTDEMRREQPELGDDRMSS
jgi:hypothetical protein